MMGLFLPHGDLALMVEHSLRQGRGPTLALLHASEKDAENGSTPKMFGFWRSFSYMWNKSPSAGWIRTCGLHDKSPFWSLVLNQIICDMQSDCSASKQWIITLTVSIILKTCPLSPPAFFTNRSLDIFIILCIFFFLSICLWLIKWIKIFLQRCFVCVCVSDMIWLTLFIRLIYLIKRHFKCSNVKCFIKMNTRNIYNIYIQEINYLLRRIQNNMKEWAHVI